MAQGIKILADRGLQFPGSRFQPVFIDLGQQPILACQPAVAEGFTELIAFFFAGGAARDEFLTFFLHRRTDFGEDRLDARGIGDAEFGESLASFVFNAHLATRSRSCVGASMHTR